MNTNKELYTPIQLSEKIRIPTQIFNMVLIELGYQTKKGNKYKLTSLGQSKGGAYAITFSRSKGNIPVCTLKWPIIVAEEVKYTLHDTGEDM